MKNIILIIFLYFTIFPVFAFGNNSSDVGIPMKKKLAVSNNQWQLVKSANGYLVRDGKKSWMFTLKNGQCGEELPKHSDCKTDRQRSEATQKNMIRYLLNLCGIQPQFLFQIITNQLLH